MERPELQRLKFLSTDMAIGVAVIEDTVAMLEPEIKVLQFEVIQAVARSRRTANPET
ncbi:MAG: hypothetical protein JWS12_603 [Candidatus Saccharibacteria bacterium]|nr:hypothetical protein [Candidatus Saccharibacteria bacterium]